ncbi:MAG: hypothetical protein ACI4F0_01505 [Agathobacter sp.]
MKKADWLITVIGLILLGAGLYMVKTFDDAQGIMLTLPYILIGVGCGAFGSGISNIISKKAISKDADLQKKLTIEENDERNIAIANRSKAKAFDCMTFVFGILMLTFALMNFDMAATLLLVAAYLFVHIYGIYFRFKYEKEM